MNRAKHLASILALATAAWPLDSSVATPRCYPTDRFVVLNDGLVRDTLTRLVWQQQASATGMDWAGAMDLCSSSGLRLPTVKEFLSLVDRTVLSPPTINQSAFPDTPVKAFWTSSAHARRAGYAWGVGFFSGYTNAYSTGTLLRVRCVR